MSRYAGAAARHYYTLRVMEFCVLWSVLVGMTGASLEEYRSTVHLSLCSTVRAKAESGSLERRRLDY